MVNAVSVLERNGAWRLGAVDGVTLGGQYSRAVDVDEPLFLTLLGFDLSPRMAATPGRGFMGVASEGDFIFAAIPGAVDPVTLEVPRPDSTVFALG
mmetsp:Transcript_6188/g.12147  ORF Transcript_6188/g.12147 Transcript_6188/m.12147 type:complete len:96 (+) Transcript_6188:3970-4257(+)